MSNVEEGATCYWNTCHFIPEGDYELDRILAEGRMYSVPRVGEIVQLDDREAGERRGVSLGRGVTPWEVVEVHHICNVANEEDIAFLSEKFEAKGKGTFELPFGNVAYVYVKFREDLVGGRKGGPLL